MRRIARGLQKFVIENPEPFIVDFKFDNRPKGADNPMNTITAVNGYGIVSPSLTKYHGEKSPREVRGQMVNEPLLTADTSNRYGLVTAFLSKYYDGGYHGKGNTPTEPLNTITAIDHHAIVTSHLMLFRNYSVGQDATEPMNTVMTSAGHFGEVRAFMVKYYGQGNAQAVSEPFHTITSKDRLGLVTIHDEDYAIVDIGLRMLTPRELFNAQGFPPDYVIDVGPDGRTITKAAQVARCGNAVPPPFAEALTRVNLPELCGCKIGTMRDLLKEMVG